MPEDQEHMYFGFLLRLNSGNQFSVFRGKEKSGWLQIQIPLALSPEHLAMLDKLSKEQGDGAMEEITLEMNRSRISYFMMNTVGSPPFPGIAPTATTKPTIFQQTILLSKTVPINEISEPRLLDALNGLDSEVGIVRGITDLTLERYSRTQSSAKQQ